jgi:acyl-coenzyme A thioesterase PaaI-like protein
LETGLVTCEGKVINVGGRVATAEARVIDRAGKLYAHATTTCLLMRPASGAEGSP